MLASAIHVAAVAWSWPRSGEKVPLWFTGMLMLPVASHLFLRDGFTAPKRNALLSKISCQSVPPIARTDHISHRTSQCPVAALSMADMRTSALLAADAGEVTVIDAATRVPVPLAQLLTGRTPVCLVFVRHFA
jgi:hypothetical protein